MSVFVSDYEVSRNFDEIELLLKEKKYIDISVLLLMGKEEKLLLETKIEDDLRKFYLFHYTPYQIRRDAAPHLYFESELFEETPNEKLHSIFNKAKGFYSHYYVFLHPDKICNSFYDLVKLHEERLYGKQIDSSKYFLNREKVDQYMTHLEGWGLVFKKFHYYHKCSDFGNDNFIYEIVADQRYTKMHHKPAIRFQVDPRGRTYGLLYKNNETIEISEKKLNLQSNFFDDMVVCINFDSVPEPEYAYSGSAIGYGYKKFCPHVLKEAFILTKTNPTTDSFDFS